MKKTFTLISAFAFCAQVEAQMCFNPPTNYSEPSPMSIATGDLNGDGFADMVTSTWSSGLSVRFGNGVGALGSATTFSTGSAAISVIIDDMNNDSKADLICSNYISGSLSVLLGNGAGSFAAAVNYTVSSDPMSVISADFNSDGKKDLAVIHNATGAAKVSVLLGTGIGTFGTPTTFNCGSSAEEVICGDFNGDGKLDLVTSEIGYAYVYLLTGNGNGTFGAATTIISNLSGPAGLTSGDFNSDGKLDVAVCNYYTSGGNRVSIALNNGSGTFATPVDYPVGTNPYKIVAADLDNDGTLDLATANIGSNNVSILKGNANGTFAAAVAFPVNAPSAIRAIDFNGDGKKDLATGNQNAYNSSILLNCNTVGINEPLKEKALSVYPNPSSDAFTISNAPTGDYKIVDLLGQTVKEFFIENNSDFKVEIKELNNGLYFLVNENTFVVRQIIKK